jgi:phenylpropionate dioxygenase-like ring-hydroxylating dioxygenase large terminal subunit
MNRKDQIALIERLLDLIDRRTPDMANTCYERDATAYYDPARFEAEKEALFRRTPLWAGFSCDLPEPNNFLTHYDTGVPILVVRKGDGTVAAYANICRHRGTRLVEEPCGRGRKTFSCPYHGWTYDHDGRLIGIPYSEGFKDLDRTKHGLMPMPVAEKFGMIFVCGTPGMNIDLELHLGDIGRELESWGLATVHPVCKRSIDVPINWKLALDTYAEGYHFSKLHHQTIAQLSHTNVATYDRFAPHYRLCFPALSIAELRNQSKELWNPLEYMSLVYYIFPNLSLNVTGTRRRTIRVFKIVPGKDVGHSTTVHNAYSVPFIENKIMRESFMQHFDYMHRVIRDEDYAVAIGVQEGLASGFVKTFVFGRNEPALIDMHKHFDFMLSDTRTLGPTNCSRDSE